MMARLSSKNTMLLGFVVSVLVLLEPATSVPATGNKCEDFDPECSSLLLSHYCGDGSLVSRLCPRSCNLCALDPGNVFSGMLAKCSVSLAVMDPQCNNSEAIHYRKSDGSCNNLQHPSWGKSFEPQKRHLPPQYSHGFLPRMRGVTGELLPSPRLVSRFLSHPGSSSGGQSAALPEVKNVSNMVMAWGQILAHDFTGTPFNNSAVSQCCERNLPEELKMENGGPCFPIEYYPGDMLMRACMGFTRSLPATTADGTHISPRQQKNILTSFLDASAVYGNDADQLKILRGEHGLMAETNDSMLPHGSPNSLLCLLEDTQDYCMKAGDHRVNVFVGLGGLHTALNREHNRIVKALSSLNPHWSAETLFQEARKIVSAEMQHITYQHYLPLLLGPQAIKDYQLDTHNYLYDPHTNPTVANVFSTAALRFGHSQVKQEVQIGNHTLPLQDTLQRPKFTLNNLTAIYMGLMGAPTDAVDRHFATGLTDHTFETSPGANDGFDLLAFNIHRGRDHGLAPFNQWRQYCNLSALGSFHSEELTVDNLENVYGHVDDIDAYVGMVIEKPVTGALVGPTLICLMGKQFHDMKFGDRFFYETQGGCEGFTADQLREIRKVSLPRIICDNIEDVSTIQRDIFLTKNTDSNPEVSCSSFPSIDLQHWRSSV